jgi:hypothetical protein
LALVLRPSPVVNATGGGSFFLTLDNFGEMIMMDPTENTRREIVAEINNNPSPREALEAEYGQVWDTTELQKDFEVLSFFAPACVVKRRSDGVRGTVTFQHSPRIYYGFSGE